MEFSLESFWWRRGHNSKYFSMVWLDELQAVLLAFEQPNFSYEVFLRPLQSQGYSAVGQDFPAVTPNLSSSSRTFVFALPIFCVFPLSFPQPSAAFFFFLLLPSMTVSSSCRPFPSSDQATLVVQLDSHSVVWGDLFSSSGRKDSIRDSRWQHDQVKLILITSLIINHRLQYS